MKTLNQYCPNIHVFILHSFSFVDLTLYYNNAETLGGTGLSFLFSLPFKLTKTEEVLNIGSQEVFL